VQPQSSSLFAAPLHAATAQNLHASFDAAPGGPALAAHRAASVQLTRGHSRSFDAAPGSPLPARSSSTASESAAQQVTYCSAERMVNFKSPLLDAFSEGA
jgi:hypothetical protein